MGMLIGLVMVASNCTADVGVCEPGVNDFTLEVVESDGIRVEYHILGQSGSSIHDPAIGPDARIWYVDSWRDCVGALDPATGDVVEYPTRQGAGPHGIDVGDDGTVWYAATATGRIGRLGSDSRSPREYEIADGFMDPHTVLSSKDRVWFTAPRANVYGYLDPASERIETFAGPMADSGPYGLAEAPDGSIWISFGGSSHVGRVSPETDALTLFPLPEASRAHRISVALDGMVWYTDRIENVIGSLDPHTEQVQSYPAFSDRAFPLSIVTDSNGHVWYYEEGTSRLVRLRPKVLLQSAVALDLPGVIVRHMVADPSTGDVWISLGEVPGVARVSSMNGDS